MAFKPEDTAFENNSSSRGAGGTTATAEFVRTVRYGAMRVVGEFSAKPSLTLGCGQKVVVETDRGIELGEPIGVCGCDRKVPKERVDEYVKNSGPEFCKPRAGRILRIATDQDINEHEHLNAHIHENVKHCAELAHQLGLDIRIITAEHLLGGEQIVFYFGAPGRIDFRQLVRDLAHHYHTRIVMRQVGARDEARLVADYEICGRECCCKNFLKKLRPVTMKMAKLQKSTLDPSKVSGRCGRLRCCLRYEQEGYEELDRALPRVGARVLTEMGAGTVVDRQILTHLLMVRIDGEDQLVAVPNEELLDRLPADGRLESPDQGVRLPQARPGRPARPPRDAAAPTEPPAAGDAPRPPAPPDADAPDTDGPAPRRSRRRRRRRGPENAGGPPHGVAPRRDGRMDAGPSDGGSDGGTSPPGDPPQPASEGARSDAPRRKRRRGRRRHPRPDGPAGRGPDSAPAPDPT